MADNIVPIALPITFSKVCEVVNQDLAGTNTRHLFAANGQFNIATGVFDNNYVGIKDRLSNFRGYQYIVGDTTPPTFTTQLYSTGKTDTSISLAWVSTDNVEVTFQELYWRVSGGTWATIALTPNQTSYIKIGLTANTTYEFIIFARDVVGNEASSSLNETTTTTPVGCGASNSYSGGTTYPSSQLITLGSDTGDTILQYNAISIPDRFIAKWNNVVVIDTGYRGAANYDIGGAQRQTFKNSCYGKVDPITGNTYPNMTDYPDDGYPRIAGTGYGSLTFNKNLSNPTIANVEVYAPMPGTAWSFIMYCPGVVPIAAPDTPTGLVMTSSTDTTISIAWDAMDRATSYQIFVNGVHYVYVSNTTTYTITGRAIATSYNIQVAAHNSGGVSPRSPIVAMSTTGDVIAPLQVTGVTATTADASSVISWNATTDNIGVVEYRVTVSDNETTPNVYTNFTSGLTFNQTGLVNGRLYTVTVQARDAAMNWSPISASVNFTPQAPADTTPPSVPTGLSGTYVAPNITVTWGASTDNVGVTVYNIQRKINNGLYANMGNTSSLSFVDTNVMQSVIYTYKISAVDAAGNNSGYSGELEVSTVVTDTIHPSTPTGLYGISMGSNIDLYWNEATDNVGVSGYYIYRDGVYIGQSTTPNYLDNTSLNTDYNYRVQAFDAAGNISEFSSYMYINSGDIM